MLAALCTPAVTSKPSHSCSLPEAIYAQTIPSEQRIAPHHTFSYADKYCLLALHAKNRAIKPSLASRKLYSELDKRYIEAYSSLAAQEDKAAFVDLFLVKSSRNHHVRVADGHNIQREPGIVFTFADTHVLRINIKLNLFPGESVQDKYSLLALLNQLSEQNTVDRKFADLVDYVISDVKPENNSSPISWRDGQSEEDS